LSLLQKAKTSTAPGEAELEIRIAETRVVLRQGGTSVLVCRLGDFVRELASRGDRARPSCGIPPSGTRLWLERGDAVALAIEIAPHARTVTWQTDASEASRGPMAEYKRYFVAFPYVILLILFQGGAVTRCQVFYRSRSLDEGDESLLFPNLYNVTPRNQVKASVCLQNLGSVKRLSWPRKVAAIVDHIFTAAFNRDLGDSLWVSMKESDPRVSSMEKWEEETRRDPRFVLDVPWKSAGTTVTAELSKMLDAAVAPLEPQTVNDLINLVALAGWRRGR
jgi:hypothetical protein